MSEKISFGPDANAWKKYKTRHQPLRDVCLEFSCFRCFFAELSNANNVLLFRRLGFLLKMQTKCLAILIKAQWTIFVSYRHICDNIPCVLNWCRVSHASKYYFLEDSVEGNCVLMPKKLYLYINGKHGKNRLCGVVLEAIFLCIPRNCVLFRERKSTHITSLFYWPIKSGCLEIQPALKSTSDLQGILPLRNKSDQAITCLIKIHIFFFPCPLYLILVACSFVSLEETLKRSRI